MRSPSLVSLLFPVLLAGLGACAAPTSGDGDVSESASDLSSNESTAFSYFVNKGLSKVPAAAIVGNLIQESSVIPTAVEPGGPGRGIAQWSVGGRWDHQANDNVEWFAGKEGVSATSLSLQLDFIWYELETFSNYGLASLKAATTLSSAVVVFQTDFEVCGTCDQTQRIEYAQEVLTANGGATSGSTTASSGCYSATLGRETVVNTCVQSKSDSLWYQCDDGEWVPRASDPSACVATFPLE